MGFSSANPLFFLWAMTATVSGLVVDETGVSLTGRVLGLAPDDLAWAKVSVGDRAAAVDAGGHYRIPDVSPGEWTVYATAGHRFLREDNVVLSPDTPEAVLDLVFPPAFEVRGQVTSPEGEPLSKAEVSFSKRGHAAISIETGKDGTFSVRLEDGDYSATAKLEGYFATDDFTTDDFATDADRSVTVSGISVAGMDFQLQRGAGLTGRVLGIEPGAGQAKVMARSQEWRYLRIANADQEGNYRISGIAPGAWKILAWEVQAAFSTPAGDQRRGQGYVTLSSGETEAFLDIDLTLDPLDEEEVAVRRFSRACPGKP